MVHKLIIRKGIEWCCQAMDNIPTFLDNLLAQIANTGIDVTNLKIDHIAYSTASTDEYEKVLPYFLKTGPLVKEAIIGNRRVAVIKFTTPYTYKTYSFGAMEVIEPLTGGKPFSGWEHAEFKVDSFDKFMEKHPNLPWNTAHKRRPEFARIKLVLPSGLEVKFLETPLLVSAHS
jgi:predicted metalloenzyme YecM